MTQDMWVQTAPNNRAPTTATVTASATQTKQAAFAIQGSQGRSAQSAMGNITAHTMVCVFGATIQALPHLRPNASATLGFPQTTAQWLRARWARALSQALCQPYAQVGVTACATMKLDNILVSVMKVLELWTVTQSAQLGRTANSAVVTDIVPTIIHRQNQSMVVGYVCAILNGLVQPVKRLNVTSLYRLRGGAHAPAEGWLRVYAIKRSVIAETVFHLPPVRQRSVLVSAAAMECVTM